MPTFDVASRASFISVCLIVTPTRHRVTTQSIVPVFASATLAMTPREIGMLFTISGLSVFMMILPAGFVIDKVGRK